MASPTFRPCTCVDGQGHVSDRGSGSAATTEGAGLRGLRILAPRGGMGGARPARNATEQFQTSCLVSRGHGGRGHGRTAVWVQLERSRHKHSAHVMGDRLG